MMNIVVVGTGFMGKLHCQVVSQSALARLVGVVEVDAHARDLAAMEFGVDAFESVEDAMAALDVDAFIVAVPDTKHIQGAVPALRTGKPVLLEKPLAHSVSAAREIVHAAQESGSRLLVGHLLRHDPRYSAAAAAVRAGDLGSLVHVNAVRIAAQAVGRRLGDASRVLYYLGIHDIDAIQWICDSRITRIFSRANSVLATQWGSGSEDVVVSSFELDNGVVGTLCNGWTRVDSDPVEIDGRLELFGTIGSLEVDVRNHGLTLKTGRNVRMPDGLHWPNVNGFVRGDLEAEVRHFIEAVTNDQEFVIPVRDALSAVAVNDAIVRSLESGSSELVESLSSD